MTISRLEKMVSRLAIRWKRISIIIKVFMNNHYRRMKKSWENEWELEKKKVQEFQLYLDKFWEKDPKIIINYSSKPKKKRQNEKKWVKLNHAL